MIGLSESIWEYYPHGSVDLNPHFPHHHRLLDAEEVRQRNQAILKICELYKKMKVIEPVSAALKTMWQDTGSLIKSIPWPLHNPNLAHKISCVEGPCPLPT
jgi:hypothetical protein